MERSHFTTNALRPELRYEAWRESISTVFDVQPAANENSLGREAAEIESHRLGGGLVVRVCAGSQVFSRSPEKIAEDSLDHYLVQVFTRGKTAIVRCTTPTNEGLQTAPGDIVIIDTAQPYQAINSQFENRTLVIARSVLAPLLNQPDEHGGRILRCTEALNSLLSFHLQSLFEALPRLQPLECDIAEASAMQLLAAVLNGQPYGPEQQGAVSGVQLLRMKQYIIQHLEEPSLGVDSLESRFRISRASLYRLFKPMGGVVAYVRKQRLRMAYRRLRTASAARVNVADMAVCYGYSSESAFTRAFKREFFCLPSEARVLRLQTRSSQLEPSNRQWEQWISQL